LKTDEINLFLGDPFGIILDKKKEIILYS